EDERARAVRVPAPAVERAHDLPPQETPGSLEQFRGAVPAGVVEGPDALFAFANDQDGLIADDVLGKITDLGNLLEAARHLPGVTPEALFLEFEELPVVVALSRHREPILHGERIRPLAVQAFVGQRHHDLLSRTVTCSVDASAGIAPSRVPPHLPVGAIVNRCLHPWTGHSSSLRLQPD